MNDLHEGGSSSNPGPTTTWWKGVWKLSVPMKIRMFVWRVARGWIPTNSSLAKRGIQVDTRCPRCKITSETVFHAIWSCREIKPMWKATSWWGDIKGCFGGDIISLLMHIHSCLSTENFEVFVTLMWSAWNRRNDTLHNGKWGNLMELINWSTHYLDEFRMANRPKAKEVGTHNRSQKWAPPDPGVTAISVDAATLKTHARCGFGGILRTETRRIRGAFSFPCARPFSPLMAELYAVIKGLKFALEES